MSGAALPDAPAGWQRLRRARLYFTGGRALEIPAGAPLRIVGRSWGREEQLFQTELLLDAASGATVELLLFRREFAPAALTADEELGFCLARLSAETAQPTLRDLLRD